MLLDKKLSWNGQVLASKTKALKSIGGLAGLAGSVWGAKLPQMRQMLQSVVIPQLTYACSVWYTPQGGKRHNKTHLGHLTGAQYQAISIITGAYKATSAPALDIETFTIPVKQKLEWLTSNAMLRIASSPSYANIVDSRTKSQIYLSPLQILTDRYERLFKSLISNIEQTAPFTAPQW